MDQRAAPVIAFEVGDAPGHRRNTFSSAYQKSSSKFHLTSGEDGNKRGMITGMFNIANTTMGVALMSMPFVARKSGVIPFVLFTSVCVGTGFVTLRMLITVCDYVPGGTQDYIAVSRAALGAKGPVISACAIWMSCTGALTAYFVLVGDLGPAVLNAVGVRCVGWQAKLGAATLIIGPLCSLKNVSALAPTSVFACFVFLLMFITSVIEMCTDFFYSKKTFKIDGYPQEEHGVQWFPSAFGLEHVGQFTTIIVAFNCQYAVLPILSNVQSKMKKDLATVCAGGLTIAYVVYVLVALSAYIAYQEYTDNMVLRNFGHCIPYCTREGVELKDCPAKDWDYKNCDDELFVVLLNGLFLLAVLMGYPCVHFALRRAQITALGGINAKFSCTVHLGLALFNISLTYGLATLVGKDVSRVFNWTGAIASPFVCFILPSIFYINILGQEGLPLMSKERVGGVAVMLYGVSIVVIGITYNITQMLPYLDI